jgi:hypothetical protein
MGIGAFFLGVKQLGHEAEVKNAWRYSSTPHTSSWGSAQLCKGETLPFMYIIPFQTSH